MTGSVDWTAVALTKEVGTSDNERLRVFSVHFQEFWNNFAEIRRNGIVSHNFERGKNGQVDAKNDLHISRHRLKGLLADYRKFHLQGDPIHFPAICRLLDKHCCDPGFRRELKGCREFWEKPHVMLLGWHNDFSPDDFMDAYFNEFIFHAGEAKRLRLAEVRCRLSDKALLIAAYDVASQRLLAVRNVNWMLQPYLEGKGYFRVRGA